jgi:hypothetical protein
VSKPRTIGRTEPGSHCLSDQPEAEAA